MEGFHQAAANMMKFLPRTRQTGELFATIIQADAPYSFEEIVFHVQIPTGLKLSAKNAPPQFKETVASGLVFECVILLLAFWRFRTRDF